MVCTSDRDAFALVTETTSVLRIINGGVEASPVLTPERLRILLGIDPWQYRQYAAMRGDTSDNLTGIRGIGEKTGVALLNAFGSVEAAFADVDTNGGARVAEVLGKACVKKLADPDGRAAFWQNVELMTMRTDLDLAMEPRRDVRARACCPWTRRSCTTHWPRSRCTRSSGWRRAC